VINDGSYATRHRFLRTSRVDGVRAVAVLAVCCSTAGGLLPGGFLGVDAFSSCPAS
jgi:peptidoglycan/LPS O-acetylase OafA/YrhL